MPQNQKNKIFILKNKLLNIFESTLTSKFAWQKDHYNLLILKPAWHLIFSKAVITCLNSFNFTLNHGNTSYFALPPIMIKELKTERLLLRQWQEEDLEQFYALNSDSNVMAYFPSILNRQERDRLARRIMALIDSQGWGFWVVEISSTHEFIGFTGLHQTTPVLPFHPSVKAGWRLAQKFWGLGYASEAANAALAFGFNELKLAEIVAFTATDNQRSRAVMERIGMSNSQQNFSHPEIPADHQLFKITRQQ